MVEIYFFRARHIDAKGIITGGVGILDQRLGDTLGFLSTKLVVPSEMNRAIFYSLGYPGDKNVFAARPYRQQYVVVTSVGGCNADGPINTNADSFYGQSGGPLWLLDGGVRYQFGVLTAMGTTSTLFAGMQPWLDAVAKAKADFP